MATIEIDGKSYKVDNGKMIIEVADENGIHIPRFCYHRKLSVAANCRMCLVQVDNSRKPVPACATPVADGMKVYTKSEETIRSQKAVMEFLLINHPLDCPICDQGGECELQDVSIGFGQGASEYKDVKRVVKSDDLGSLIATEMTRCIHCTRCVRFGDEVAGVRELGAIGRGENTQISTYVNHSLKSEIAGNIIDLCPVGALTSKPYRFTARPWEMNQYESIAPHDCLGSNVYVHVRRQQVMRVVPRDCEEINETWISDRDRFSYLGLNHASRATKPLVKKNGVFEAVDWVVALQYAAQGIKACIERNGAHQFASWASSSSTLEELYLLQRFMRELGVNNLDYRLQQTDFRDQDLFVAPFSTLPFAELEKQANILLLGTNLHREVPLAAVRVRKAMLSGAAIYAINPVSYDFPFTITAEEVSQPNAMLTTLSKVLLAAVDDVKKLPEKIHSWFQGVNVNEFATNVAAALKKENSVIVTGFISDNHPEAAILRTLMHLLAEHTGAKIIRLTQGANALGAHFAGMLPHLGAFGSALNTKKGLDVNAALSSNLKGILMLGVEPGYDFSNPTLARQALLGTEFVVALSSFVDQSLEEYADVILPIASFTETSGTYINVDNLWQTAEGCTPPKGEARPAWKVLRVLANLCNCKEFEYESTADVLAEITSLKNNQDSGMKNGIFVDANIPSAQHSLIRVGEWPLYGSDGLVRRAEALQASGSAEKVFIKIHPMTAKNYNLSDEVTICQGEIAVTLPFEKDDRVAPNVVWVTMAMPETVDLGGAYAKIDVR